MRPVVVYHGQNEFEAQIARDVLIAAGVPVLHLPSLSTGIFGAPRTTRVAVPEEFQEQAIEALADAGITGTAESPATGIAAFDEAVRETLDFRSASSLSSRSSLVRVMFGIAVVILVIAIYAAVKRN